MAVSSINREVDIVAAFVVVTTIFQTGEGNATINQNIETTSRIAHPGF